MKKNKSASNRTARRIVREWNDKLKDVCRDHRAGPAYWNGDDWGSISGFRDADEWVNNQMIAWVERAIKRTIITDRPRIKRKKK